MEKLQVAQDKMEDQVEDQVDDQFEDQLEDEDEENSLTPEEEKSMWERVASGDLLAGIFDLWDPMALMYNSPQNQPNLKTNDLGAWTTGQNSSKENLCKFYDGISDGCWKGQYCRAQHVKKAGPIISAEFPQLGVRKDKERVCSSYELDERDVGAPGSLFKAVVSCAENPGNFFLVPQFDLKCACSGICSQDVHRQKCKPHKTSWDQKFDSDRKYSGIESYNAFVKEMNAEVVKRGERNRFRNEYEAYELVAFDANSIKKSGSHPLWLRGVLQDSVYVEDGNGKFPPAEVLLFDNGHSVTTDTHHICQLPFLYGKIPPFAIRSKLYGIRPKSESKPDKKSHGKSHPHARQPKPEPQWSAEAIKDFQKLVKSPSDLMDVRVLDTKNLVVVDVKKSTCTDSDGVFQPLPYEVMITVMCEEDGEVVNVSEKMVKLGHAEFTNYNQKQCGFSFSEWEFFHPLSSLC